MFKILVQRFDSLCLFNFILQCLGFVSYNIILLETCTFQLFHFSYCLVENSMFDTNHVWYSIIQMINTSEFPVHSYDETLNKYLHQSRGWKGKKQQRSAWSEFGCSEWRFVTEKWVSYQWFWYRVLSVQ